MVKLILVTHGNMAKAMLGTAAKIYPFDKKSVAVFTVSGRADLRRIAARIKKKLSPGGALIMTDIFGGTACNISAGAAHGVKDARVLCGLNLNMLLAALSGREKLDAAALAAKALEAGSKGLFNVTEKLK